MTFIINLTETHVTQSHTLSTPQSQQTITTSLQSEANFDYCQTVYLFVTEEEIYLTSQV